MRFTRIGGRGVLFRRAFFLGTMGVKAGYDGGALSRERRLVPFLEAAWATGGFLGARELSSSEEVSSLFSMTSLLGLLDLLPAAVERFVGRDKEAFDDGDGSNRLFPPDFLIGRRFP